MTAVRRVRRICVPEEESTSISEFLTSNFPIVSRKAGLAGCTPGMQKRDPFERHYSEKQGFHVDDLGIDVLV